VLDRAFEHPLEPEEKAAMPFAGGLMQYGYQCGMIWGAVLSAGAEAYRRHGPGPKAEAAAIHAAQRLVESFRTRHGEMNCLGITDIDRSASTWKMVNQFLIKGGTIGCLRMAGWYAPLAFDEIHSALSEEAIEVSSPPVSCAAMLARDVGESDLHTVMASGLAGGIGLCGGACGALGAAIWILGMKIGREAAKRIGFRDPRTEELVDRFLQQSNYEFECPAIVGREFEDVADHADYLRKGGCSELIQVLAGAVESAGSR
jgi:hypothetical protein